MEDDCRTCKKQEEDTYWSQFKYVQFFQTLTGEYREQLAIPKKFSSNVRGVLGGIVTLRGPSGTIWNVGLTRNEDTLFFKYGWKEFVEDHCLEENEILVFKYKGDSSFDVLIFDRRSFCEKESSYFVKRCRHTELGSSSKSKANAMESFEVADGPSQDAAECTPARKSFEVAKGPLQDVVKCTPAKKSKKDDTVSPTAAALRSPAEGKIRRKTKSIKRSFLHSLQLTSHRRPVTEEEKERAVRMAEAASSERSLIVIMRATQVYEKFYMTIPAKWTKDHLNDRSQQIMLCVGERKWLVTFQHRVYGGLLMGGWKKFATENLLEEFDVCLFDVITETEYVGVVLDVHIFRVVEDVVPPSQVTASSSRVSQPAK